ncbi:hypothetical protein HMPREF9440_01257 [Sutterella parvirubra YIT 11816]|uniref:Uncharacterized protein n=1 Tax=Sutterella parvirubra YIT 11816 TaxID=762967 RepID=H3KEU2_9BURK|nr:hypothetical protein HMPREF9440_01257 [Sutterella parvirubra YIT 11816]
MKTPTTRRPHAHRPVPSPTIRPAIRPTLQALSSTPSSKTVSAKPQRRKNPVHIGRFYPIGY